MQCNTLINNNDIFVICVLWKIHWTKSAKSLSYCKWGCKVPPLHCSPYQITLFWTELKRSAKKFILNPALAPLSYLPVFWWQCHALCYSGYVIYIKLCSLWSDFFPTGLRVVMHEFGSIIIGGSRYWHVYELWVEIIPVMNHKKVVFFWVQNQYQANNVVYSLNCILGAV